MPLGVRLMPMLVSLPVAERTGLAEVAALASVKLFTAEPVAVSETRVLAPVSLIDVPITGDVSVLFVKVSVPAKVANVPVVGSVTFVVPVSVLV